MRFIVTLFAFSSLALAQGSSLFGFLANSGQFPSPIRFVRYGVDNTNFLYVTSDSFVLANGVRIQMAGINASAEPQAGTALPGVYNYYLGDNATDWITNAQEFSTVTLSSDVYPGISAAWTTSFDSIAPILGLGTLVLTIAPNADPSSIQLNVLNTGATPMSFSASQVWFTGGNIPGVFSVTAGAIQRSGATTTPVTCNLVINSSTSLSVQLSGRNPALATTLVITFPDYDVFNSSLTAGYLVSSMDYPTSFGQDGSLPSRSCGAQCSYAVVAKVNADGLPAWVSVLGGSGGDEATFATHTGSGVAVAGQTGSSDFPITPGAPHTTAGPFGEVFLAYLDANSGQLLDSTYAGLPGTAFIDQQIVNSAGDVAIGGAHTDGNGHAGFVQLWKPAQNQFIYTYPTFGEVEGLAFDAASNLYFASVSRQRATQVVGVGELDPSGNPVGSVVSIGVPQGGQAAAPQLQPTGSNGAWVAYNIDPSGQDAIFGYVFTARVIPALGEIAARSRVSQQGSIANIGLTPESNVKLLIANPAGAEATTSDAPLVAACPNTLYFAVLSPSAELVYATYAPSAGFDFANQNESPGAPQPTVSCFQSTAGRVPSTVAAPGELITIVGGGFGPLATTNASPGTAGTYPTTLDGFTVTIGGQPAPIIAVARGSIEVQVPFEVDQSGSSATINVTNGSATLPSISTEIEPFDFNLFDTGKRDNATNLPVFLALNPDGSVNAVDNPAPEGSVITLFGSGLGILHPPLLTGGLNPIPPAGPLSLTSLTAVCTSTCTPIFLGSAPGLSTGIVQIDVQISAGGTRSTGFRTLPIGVAVAAPGARIIALEPSGVVFVKEVVERKR